MIVFPPAKINLGLHIVGKRNDGYHEIETCLFPVPLFDALEIIVSDKVTFHSSGNEIPGQDKDNLVLQAYSLLKKDFNDLPSISIHLHKVIPIGAGLGGGSSDAAFALKLMSNLFDLHLEDWFLEEYAAKIGSDCPFFIEALPKIAKGRGEILEAIDLVLKGKWLILVNPNLHIGTKEAYVGVKPKLARVDLREILQDPTIWKNRLTNDFEESIFQKYPEIKVIKDSLYERGAFYASMSGSGSSVFGLFDQEPEVNFGKEGYYVFKAEM